jgi:hypothetical protein
MLQLVLLLHIVLVFMCCVSSSSRMWPYAVQGLHGGDVSPAAVSEPSYSFLTCESFLTAWLRNLQT